MPDAPAPALRAPPRLAPGAAGLVALADRCVQCGLCLPHCPTYRLDRTEAESPRGRIAYAKAVAEGRLAPTEAGDRHLDHCLGCRRCEPVCPAGVPYGELLIQARAAQLARRPLPAGMRVRLALLARPWLLRGLLALSGWLPASWRSGLPPLPPGPARTAAPATATETLAIFRGCLADGYEAPSRAALARLLATAGVALVEPAHQGCCGAAAAHAGDAAGAARLADANRKAFAGQQRSLCLASGCQATLAGSLAGITVVEDALVALDRLGDRLRFRPAIARVALHLPCTQRSVVRSEAALHRLLARVPGLDLVVLPDTGCCGAAGLHQVREPERAAALRAPLLEAFARSGAERLLSANIGCRLHLASATPRPVQHPIDFLAEHLA